MAKIIRLPVVERARAKAAKPAPVPRQWLCKRCEHDIGVASSEVITLLQAPRIHGTKLKGGTKRLACGPCYQRGIRTYVL